MSSDGHDGNREQAPLRFIELLQAVAAALLGVQSERARQRDFSRGKPMHFILIGILATIIFVLTITGIVQLVLHLATGG